MSSVDLSDIFSLNLDHQFTTKTFKALDAVSKLKLLPPNISVPFSAYSCALLDIPSNTFSNSVIAPEPSVAISLYIATPTDSTPFFVKSTVSCQPTAASVNACCAVWNSLDGIIFSPTFLPAYVAAASNIVINSP